MNTSVSLNADMDGLLCIHCGAVDGKPCKPNCLAGAIRDAWDRATQEPDPSARPQDLARRLGEFGEDWRERARKAEAEFDEYEAALNSAMGNLDKSDGSALRAVRRLVQAYAEVTAGLLALGRITPGESVTVLGMPDQRPSVAECMDQMGKAARERGIDLMEPRG